MESHQFAPSAPDREHASPHMVLKSSPTMTSPTVTFPGDASAAAAAAAAANGRPRSLSGGGARGMLGGGLGSSLGGGVGHGGIPQKIRRRNRLITSCLECRRRKLKCDKTHPCTNCTKFVRDCVYLAPALDPAAQMKLAEIKEKMGSLERTLEEDVARRARQQGPGGAGMRRRSSSGSSDEEIPGPEDERNLMPTPLAWADAAYYEDADDDDFMDLGVQVGKMRITERLGGYVRPKIAQEMAHVANFRQVGVTQGVEDPKTTAPAIAVPQTPIGPEIVAPSKEFTAPSSSFLFVDEPRRTSIMQYLPARQVAERFLEQYWEAVHYMCRVVHRPTFERQWAQFWDSIQVGLEPPASLQALVMGVLLSAAISMAEDRIVYEFGAVKQQLVDSFRQGTEMALYKANFLRTTKLHTLQAFVLFLVAVVRREVSRSHSALTGAAIRLAECMGLHRDGTHYGLSAVEVHVRRIIWFQLCFLDIRTCEATGPRPQIHKEDYDTRLPLNVNDIDLEGPNPPTEDANMWTDMTFTLLRFDCNEMHRFIWRERPLLEEKKISLTQILSKVQEFIGSTEQKYLSILNKNIPIQYMAVLVYRLLTLRMHVILLHRYATTPYRPMPERLRKILLSSGVQQVECAILVETAPPLKKWAWYLGTFHQYHTALLLLSELYGTPERYFEDRIWDCMDYVFELPASMPRREKANTILRDVVQKTQYYHSLRRVRAPKALEEGIAAAVAAAREKNNEMTAGLAAASCNKGQQAVGPGQQPGMPGQQGITQGMAQGMQQAHQHQQQQQYQQQAQHHQQQQQQQQQHQQQHAQHQQQPTRDRVNYPDPIPSDEFRNFTFMPDIQYYAREAHRPSLSPQSSEADSSRQPWGSTGCPPNQKVEIDWNEWDKLFPPDLSIPELNPPDYSNNIPRGYGNMFNYQSG